MILYIINDHERDLGWGSVASVHGWHDLKLNLYGIINVHGLFCKDNTR